MKSEPPSDVTTHPSLLVRLRDRRDGAAWGEFVRVYGPLIFSYCRMRQLQESDAADVSQEVLVRLARSLDRFEYCPERGRFRDWLGKVIHRELLRFWNRQPRRNSLEAGNENGVVDAAESAHWDEHFHAELLRCALESIRSDFNDETWRAFELTWLEQRPPGQVAELLGVGIERVYVAKSRVLKRLRGEVLRLSEDLPVSDL